MATPQSAGGRARAQTLGPHRRSEIARRAAQARWSSSRPGKTSMSSLKALARDLADAASGRATVYLFGSYARGEATPHSDLDLLVVERGLRDWLGETVRLRRVARAWTDKEVDLVVMGTRDWNKWRRHFGTVQHAAATEGIRLVG
jgi:uncharacterized protein